MELRFKSSIEYVAGSSLMWNHRIILPDTVMTEFKTTDKRVICRINESNPIHCALISKGDGTYYIMVNKEFRKKNKLEKGDEVIVEIQQDTSKYGIFTPDFFEELCFQDPEGESLFHKLTAGKQRSLLHVIGKPKSEEKQLEKALIVFDYLKSVNGQLDFKTLNIALKESRFKK